ncbi:MAG: MFS transporter [Thermoplasmataceae archaeon]
MLNKTLIAIRSLVVAIGASAASAFVGVYGVYIGATAIEMGWLQSLSNALSNGGQLIWGRLSDSVGRRKPFLVAGSVVLAVLWYMMGTIRTPVQLVIVYAAVSLFGSLITVNWYSLIADQTDSSTRGRFLSVINILSSIGTITSLVIMTFFFSGEVTSDIFIPFSTSAACYVISGVLMSMLNEPEHRHVVSGRILETLRNLKKTPLFYKYFMAMNVQGFFWSMAWPMFPITIVLVMNFSLTAVAILTVSSLSVTILVQFLLGRITDRVNRPPLIFANRVMLSAIPLFYAFFGNFAEFIFLEIYSGILGSIQNIVMNSYLLDVVPEGHRAEYISIINGFNGIIYLFGALSGGYLLDLMLGHFPLRLALIFSYLIVFVGRFLSSLLFMKLKEPERKGRSSLALYSLLHRFKQPGSPSGGTLRLK